MSTEEEKVNYSRYGVFGDVPTNALFYLIERFPRMPKVIEATVLSLSALAVLILAKDQRRAIRSNLNVIHKDLGWFKSYYQVFQVFCNFGWAFVDGRRARVGQNVITWDLEGAEIFEKIRDSKEPTILLTTHTGNYDLAASLFASKFERTLHTVRLEERSEHLKEIRKKELAGDSDSSSNLKIHYNSEDSLLGVELARLLSEGELLALQGDRVIGNVSPLEIPTLSKNVNFRIPKGPLTLACFSKCPCYPLFVVRKSYRHYRVIFEQALEVTPDKRRLSEADYGKPWVCKLLEFLEMHSDQWFVFEEAFTKKS